MRADHRFPLITQLDLEEIRDYVPNAFTLQLGAEPEGSTLRFIGEALSRLGAATTLSIAILLVVFTFYVFLQAIRTTLVPMITIPVSACTKI